jgi:hypothetical protein
MINYLEISENYRTEKIKTLLVGEAPPPSGTDYFYISKAMPAKVPIEKDLSLAATIFYHYFQTRPKTKEQYASLLDKLRDKGIFLIDILDEPLKIRGSKENEAKLIAKISNLRAKMALRKIDICDEYIIFLLARNSYKAEIRKYFPNSKLISWIDFRTNPEQ